MKVQITHLFATRILMLRHRGPYDGIGPVFDRLWEWVSANRVPVQRTIGIYWDNAEHTPASQLRSAACFEVPPSYELPANVAIPVEIGQILGGEYATTRHVGPYEEMEPVWSGLIAEVEGALGRRVSDQPAFEIYVNDPSDTPPSQLITELYVPLE